MPLRHKPLVPLRASLRAHARRWAHRVATPVRRRYYADDWGREAVARLSSWWKDRLGLDDLSAVGTRRIEIGSGSSPRPGFLHVDVNPWAPHVEVVANAWRLPFPDDWADEIVAVHSLEHIHPRQLLPTLSEWRRVLRPGGVVWIHVPNVPQLMERFTRSTIAEKWALSGALLGMYCSADTTRPEEIAWPADHQILFDAELLRWALQNAGFKNPVDRTADVFDYHTRDWKRLVSHCSLIFEARKA